MNGRPFRRHPFRSLSERPWRPHSFLTLEEKRVAVTIGDETLAMSYRQHGSGPPLLLLHGLMTTSYSWRYVIEPLSKDYTVYAPDLPGAGGSEAPRRCDVETLMGSISAFQRALDIRGCLTVANSMAGYLSMQLVLRDPEAISRLVNVHSPGVPIPRLEALRRVLAIPGTRNLLGAVVAAIPERWVHANVHYYDESLKSKEEARIYAAPLRHAAGRRAFASWLGDGLDPDEMRAFVAALEARRDRAESFPVPLQLLYARQDPMVPPSVGERLAQLVPSAEMVWVEDTSHFMHVDTPQAFLDAALPFLRQASR